MKNLRNVLLFLAISLLALAAHAKPKHSYLYVWAGDADHSASDFLGVIDADPNSKTYGDIVASIPTGVAGTHPHHTEDFIGPNNHLLADGYHAGRTWLFDLNDPLKPRILTTYGEVGGFNHPHSYLRLHDGNVLATFQYSGEHSTGGLVEMTERGKLIKAQARLIRLPAPTRSSPTPCCRFPSSTLRSPLPLIWTRTTKPRPHGGSNFGAFPISSSRKPSRSSPAPGARRTSSPASRVCCLTGRACTSIPSSADSICYAASIPIRPRQSSCARSKDSTAASPSSPATTGCSPFQTSTLSCLSTSRIPRTRKKCRAWFSPMTKAGIGRRSTQPALASCTTRLDIPKGIASM